MNTTKSMMQEERRKRVNRIKKMIIAIIIVFLLLPSILCITLWVKVVHMEEKLNIIMEMHVNEQGNEMIEEDYTVFAADEYKDSENKEQESIETTKDIEADDKTKKIMDKQDQTKIKGKKVYLTFDDGPSKNTEKILDTLKENNVKATFFVIGRTDDYSKKLYKRIYEEGHTLAMHSYTHQYQTIYKTLDAYKEDITKLSDLLYEVTGQRPKYLRFPGGSSNTVSKVDMESVILYTQEEGFVYFDWNVVNGDATGQSLTETEMVNNVISGVKQYETSIVLMHDCAGKEMTSKTLPKVIKKLKKMKVTLLPINDTTKVIQHIKVDDINKKNK